MRKIPQKIREITIGEVVPCPADPKSLRVFAKYDKNLEEILPYLCAMFPRSRFLERLNMVRIDKGKHSIYIFEKGKMVITQVKDEKELIEIINMLLDKIDEAKKALLSGRVVKIPDRRVIGPMDIYPYLPRTNCGECGVSSCFAFGIKLLADEASLEECKSLDYLSMEKIRQLIS